MWQHSALSNQTVQTLHNCSLDADSLSDLLGPLVEETPEFWEEYPQGVAEEAEVVEEVEEEAEEEIQEYPLQWPQ